MAKLASELPTQSPASQLMEFEQPLTEKMRTFLKLELLYQQALFHIEDSTDFGARAAVACLLDIVAILGRGDVRVEVIKELERQTELLAQYQRRPGVDTARLQTLIGNMDALRNRLTEAGPHFMTRLKECEFLNAIKHRSSIPGGTCMFDLPDYGYWLRRPHADRWAQFTEWMDALSPLCDGIAELLWLTRETNDPTEQVAIGGLYQHSLDRSESFNLVRVMLPAATGLYPEISAGQHRFTIRLVRWQGAEARAAQASQDVRFWLALC
jgi:cell division protein ZapD